MPDEELSNGEIRRWLERIDRSRAEDNRARDDRMTSLARDMVPHTLWAAEHKALEDTVSEVREDMRSGFDRIERTSQERKAVLERADAENAKATAAVRKMVEDDRKARDARRPGTLTNWLTGIGVAVAVIALIVTIVATTHGGH